MLTEADRDLFPRSYGLIAASVLEYLYASAGSATVQGMLADMDRKFGTAAASRINVADDDEAAAALAEQLGTLGYEALAVRHGDETQIEAKNCVFHALAAAYPDVCRFDLAFMEAATGRPIQHLGRVHSIRCVFTCWNLDVSNGSANVE